MQPYKKALHCLDKINVIIVA